jgi:hypothetical protein
MSHTTACGLRGHVLSHQKCGWLASSIMKAVTVHVLGKYATA